MRLHHTLCKLTPRRTMIGALCVVTLTGPATLAALPAWLLGWLPAEPVLVLMVYLLLLAVTIGAGIVAALAATYMAVHEAFTAGYQTAAAGQGQAPATPVLRVLK